jgi:hypothetical protein
VRERGERGQLVKRLGYAPCHLASGITGTPASTSQSSAMRHVWIALRIGLTMMSCTLRSAGRWDWRCSRSSAACCRPRSERDGSGREW